MTHQQSIREIRRQMALALGAGKIGEYLVLLSQLETMQMSEAQRVDNDKAMARMTNAYRGGW